MSTLETPCSLSTLRDSFARCRAGRRRAQFPIDLKYQAVSLLEHYGTAELAQALDVGANCLSRWKKECLQNKFNQHQGDVKALTSTVSSSGFVSLPSDSISSSDSALQSFPLTISLGTEQDPHQLRLQAEVTLPQWHQLLTLVSQALVP